MMTDSKKKAALQVAEYRRRSGLRRANSKLKNTSGSASSGVIIMNGVVIIQAMPKEKSTKTVAQAGGVSKVFGKSTISIPEFRKSSLRK